MLPFDFFVFFMLPTVYCTLPIIEKVMRHMLNHMVNTTSHSFGVAFLSKCRVT